MMSSNRDKSKGSHLGVSSVETPYLFSYTDGSLLQWRQWASSYNPRTSQSVRLSGNMMQNDISWKANVVCEVEGRKYFMFVDEFHVDLCMGQRKCFYSKIVY